MIATDVVRGAKAAGRGDKKTALEHGEEALAIRLQLAKEHPQRTDVRRDVAGIYHTLASAHDLPPRDADASLKSLERSIEAARSLAKDQPQAPEFRDILAAGLINRANRLKDRKQYDEAAAGYREGIAVIRRLVRERPQVERYRIALAQALMMQAIVESLSKRADAAIQIMREADAVSRPFAKRPEQLSLRGQIVMNLGVFEWQSDRLDRAGKLLKQSLSLHESAMRASPTNVEYRLALFRMISRLATVQRKSERPLDCLLTCTTWGGYATGRSDQLVDIAAEFAQCAAMFDGNSPAEQRLRSDFASRAIVSLRKQSWRATRSRRA